MLAKSWLWKLGGLDRSNFVVGPVKVQQLWLAKLGGPNLESALSKLDSDRRIF